MHISDDKVTYVLLPVNVEYLTYQHELGQSKGASTIPYVRWCRRTGKETPPSYLI
jgi:hypothetical protein